MCIARRDGRSMPTRTALHYQLKTYLKISYEQNCLFINLSLLRCVHQPYAEQGQKNEDIFLHAYAHMISLGKQH